MANLALGLNWDKDVDNYLAGVRSYAGESHGPIYVRWYTDTGTDWNKLFTISVAYKYVLKGVTGLGDSDWSQWSNTYWSEIPAAQCNPHKVAGKGGWSWSYPLGDIGHYVNAAQPSGTTIGQLVAPNGWSFSSRKYDSLIFRVALRSTFQEGKVDAAGNNYSRLERNELWCMYCPVYTLTDAYLDVGMTIEYSVTDWPRLDDRYQLEEISQGGVNLVRFPAYFNTISESGKIHLSEDEIGSLPTSGPTHIRIRFNEGFREQQLDNLYLEGDVNLVVNATLNTPSLTISEASPSRLVVTVGDSGDKGSPIDSALVYIRGYDGILAQSVPVGGQAEFANPPLGTVLYVEAYAQTETAVSETATLLVQPIGQLVHGEDLGYVEITPESGTAGVRMRFNVSEDWGYTPESDTMKFSGRLRESVAYGVGGSVTGTIQCDILDDQRYGDLYQSRYDFEALPFAGPCVLRGPGGEYRRVAVDSVGESFDIVAHKRRMKVSVREVS